MSRTSAREIEALINRGVALLAGRQALDAIQLFADAYAMAVTVGEQAAAARAILGHAWAEFAVRRLSLAADHANTARELSTALAMPQAEHAADLVIQIHHNRYL